jgi:hypothetical protein
MFERYSESARRVIFYARYEASQYGSRYIEAEHILLGLLWEEGAIIRQVLGPHSDRVQIRAEIEKVITKAERFSTSVEVPLTEESKKVLNFAAEEATGLGQRSLEPVHLLLGLLRVKGSRPMRILSDRGIWLEALREQLAKDARSRGADERQPASDVAIATLNGFLVTLESPNWAKSAVYFARTVQFIDARGELWRGYNEIENQFELLFLPYAKRDVAFHLESAEIGPAGCVVASVLWQNVSTAGGTARSMHRMTIILAQEGTDLAIFLVQVTPVAIS